MGSINKQISRYEATAVYTHPDAKVDIVLVHGLNGDPQKTWTAKNGVFWPADLLPTSLREARANVLVYGYNADVYSKKHGANPSDNFIYMHAQTLVTSLTHYRKDELSSRNPIIWVCHSLGGILVKRALLYSNDLRTPQHEDYRSIYVSTYGIIFLGTPHTGSDIAVWGSVLQAMSDAVVPKSFFQSESVLLRTLKRDNETLQNINSHFLDIYQRFKILMAHENHKTDFKGTRMLVVDSTSASPQLPGVTYYAIEATHSGMCKFDSKNAPGYRTVATAIRDWVLDAPDVIATRWRVEEDEKLARAKHEIEERMKPWLNSQRIRQSDQGSIRQQNNDTTLPPSEEASKIEHQSKPLLPEPETPNHPPSEEYFPSQESKPDQEKNSSPEPIFVKPTVFRPNTYFKGREKEMKLLHRMLTDRKRRSVGTSSVLIQSMPGGGKSHLARQYVFQHKYDYPGGIFWIRAKSIQELEYGYWDIAKTAGLSEVTNLDRSGVNDTLAMVKAVQAWLSRTEDWLLVLDGIHFDLPDLQHYIPFAKNTSIIYTSTERTTGEEYQFDNPQTMILDPLTKSEAQELLFEEMGKKKPWTQDDLKRAEELIELMDRLPLMIHVAALQLKATREPLAKYLRSYRSRPKVGNLPAYRSVREQLEHRGATAALNLIRILAFFGTHIPVEMVVLGAKALDKRTPVRSADPETRRVSLNNTFKVLIAFALIERNENNEAISSSSHSTRSVDMGQDNLDILRIHGIVQAFFVDILAEEKEVPFWLERAVCVFCRAFDASDRRVDTDPQTGVPEDYRRFLIHGRRLLSHLDRFEKKDQPLLAPCREVLEQRIDMINGRIDKLTRRVTEATGQAVNDGIISVFERTNSLSEADSDSPPSNNSLIDAYLLEDGTEPLESPSIYMPGEWNPYHWHVTYPYGAPYVSTDDLDGSSTVTPKPGPTAVFESMSMPDDDETTRRVFGPNHRTIKKHAERRYRDHAGSWRASPQIVSDPRVSISRETARGFIFPSAAQQAGFRPSTSDSVAVAGSEAEFSLNQIKQVSPSVQKESTVLVDATILPGERPKLIAGRTSYANAKTEVVDDGFSITPTFSYPPPSSKDAAANIMRLKDTDRPVSVDGLAPVKISSPLTAAPLDPESMPTPVRPAVQHLPTDEEPEQTIPKLPSRPPSRPPSGPPSGPPSRPSSPSWAQGPFQPPPIPIEVNTTSSLRSGATPPQPQGAPRYWEQPHIQRYAINEEDDEHHNSLTHSLPSIHTYPTNPPLPYPHHPHQHHPHPHAVPIPLPPGSFTDQYHHPAPWVAAGGGAISSSPSSSLHPQGYSSQPMSRNASHQSSASHASASTSSNQSAAAILRSPSSHSPRASGGVGGGSPSPPQPIPSPPSGSSSTARRHLHHYRRRRPPSVVETEPSPRLPPSSPFGTDPVLTSYQLHHHYYHHYYSRTAGILRRLSRRSRSEGRGRGRGSGSGGRGGGDGGGGDMPAARSASGPGPGPGGFRLADGRVVEFGAAEPVVGGESESPSPSPATVEPRSPRFSIVGSIRRGSLRGKRKEKGKEKEKEKGKEKGKGKERERVVGSEEAPSDGGEQRDARGEEQDEGQEEEGVGLGIQQ
ncbi:hypothetical protein F5X96DRAFT_679902 [Biscogniauxia mediterranea]|nr:hypothetical protein F5X96DRAFT_679902 [Biscogniauxia mediterranea]